MADDLPFALPHTFGADDTPDAVAAVTAMLDPNTLPVEQVVPIVTTLAKAYTRGRGFVGNTPNAEIAAVVVTAAVRLAGNARQTSMSFSGGPFTQDQRSFWQGWNLAELAVLNRYRVRAM